MSNAILKASKNLRRDYGELEKLQNSKTSVSKFVENSFSKALETIKIEFQNARPEWKFTFRKEDNDSEIIKKDSEEKFCLIKPISGINNFSKGISYFAISAIYYNRLEPEAAVIYDPIKDELFYTEKGRGAFVNNSRIRFSSTKKLSEAVFVFDCQDTYIEFLNNKILRNLKSKIRIFGCSCLDVANLASGKFDCYITQKELNETFEPGALLIKEAGGIFWKSQSVKNMTFYSNNNILYLLENKL